MAIVVQCPKCGQRFAAAAGLAGRQLPCSRCGATVSVPGDGGGTQRGAEAPAPAQAADSSSIVVACDHCGQRFAAAAWLAGRSVPCANCGHDLKVPAAGSASAPSEVQVLDASAAVLESGSDLDALDQHQALDTPFSAAEPDMTPRYQPAHRSPSQSQASLDDIPSWLWWAGGGALGLCVLVFAVMIISSLLRGCGPPAAPQESTVSTPAIGDASPVPATSSSASDSQ